MNLKVGLALAAALISVPSISYAQAALVQIISPMDGAEYPRTGSTGAGFAIVAFSIATRCFDDSYSFSWGVDNDILGETSAVADQGTVQFTTKVAVGQHIAWAKTTCGANAQADFYVQ